MQVGADLLAARKCPSARGALRLSRETYPGALACADRPGSMTPGQELSALDALKDFLSDPLLGVRAIILLRIDWLSGLIGALLW
jgi:hypothetical protein